MRTERAAAFGSPSIVSMDKAVAPMKYAEWPRRSLVAAVAGIAVLILTQNASALLAVRREDFGMLAVTSAMVPLIFGPLSVRSAFRGIIAFAMLVMAIVLFGPGPAAWLAGGAGVACCLLARIRQPLRLAFAGGSHAISAFVGGIAFQAAGGTVGNVISTPQSLAIGAASALAVLTVLRALAAFVGHGNHPTVSCLIELICQLPGHVAMGGFGIGLAVLYLALGPTALLLFLVPATATGHSLLRYVDRTDALKGDVSALEVRLREMQVTNQISSHFASMRTLEQTLEVVAAAATELPGFQWAFLLTFKPTCGWVGPAAVSGLSPQRATQVSKQLQEFVPVVVATRAPIVLSGEYHALHLQALRSAGVEAASIVIGPIIRSDQCIGVLVVGSMELPSAERLGLLQTLISQAALAVDNASTYLSVARLANTDYVTGLFNHRFFQENLATQVAKHKTTGDSLTLVMIDIDNFKGLNDRYGHPAGDQVLRQVATTLKSAVRSDDTVCRYGGDEFAVILPHSDANQALRVAERIRQAVKGAAFALGASEFGPRKVHLTISVGIAVTAGGGVSQEELVARADLALQRTKEGGRDNCSLFDARIGIPVRADVAEVRGGSCEDG